MALIKEVETDFGVNSCYWNIGAVQEDFKGRGTEVTFYGYASKEARQAGWPSIQQQAHYVNVADLSGDIIPALYNVLKTFTQYSGSTDV